MGVIEWELIGIIVTLMIGFASVFLRIGKREEQITTLQRDMKQATQALKEHEEQCTEREKTVNERLEKGSKEMALLHQGQKHIKETVDEIKQMLSKRG